LRRGERGLTLIEALIATLIVGVSLMALMSAWLYSFNMTRSTDELTVSYNLGRIGVERMRAMGYFYADPNGMPEWWDANMQPTTQQNASYRVVTTITTGRDASRSQYNLKQIEVVVVRVSDGAELFRTQTYLTWGGA
jgi:Tfp pilus assembly protein PilV